MDFTPDTPKRLRQWLQHKLDRGDCPGLIWIDKQTGKFKIPWHHYKDVAEEQKPIVFKLFVDWALFTNKYKEGEDLNYPAVKHNFRCALNKLKQDFDKLQDNSGNKFEPHIVYRFVNSDACQQVLSSSGEHQNDLNMPHDQNIPTVVHSLAAEHMNDLGYESPNIHGVNGEIANANYAFPDFLESPEPNFEYSMAPSQSSPAHVSNVLSEPEHNFKYSPVHMSEVPNLICGDINDAQYAEMNDNTSVEAKPPSDLESVDFNDLIPPQASNALPMSGTNSLNTPETSLELGALCKASTAACGSSVLENQSKHRMTVKIYYGQPPVQMMSKNVEEKGCRIFFGDSLLAETKYHKELYGSKEVDDLKLPIVHHCSEHITAKQTDFILAILKEMDRGFTLTFKNGDIYAQRFCKTRVFYCDGEFHSTCLDRKSKDPNKVFDFNDFQSKLTEWCLSSGQSRLPPAHFYITLGKEVNPAHENGPMSKVLISVCVTHCAAESLLRQAEALAPQQGDSMEPQKSFPNSLDRLLDFYKALTINPK